jgi:long-chain acyl-CoA synthetase
MKDGNMMAIFHRRVEELGGQPALRRKVNGQWEALSWRQYGDLVQRAARGFIALGLQRNQAVGILGFNRVEWVVSYLAAMGSRAVPVGIYTTSSPEQVQYIVAHSEAPIVVVENEEQLAKLRAVRSKCPALRWVVTMDPPSKAREDWVISFAELLERAVAVPPSAYLERVEEIEPTGLATLIYTSGTTGPPKAVMLSHNNLHWTAQQAVKLMPGIGVGSSVVSYLPLSHIAEQQFSIHLALIFGAQVWFAESLEPMVLRQNIVEVKPAGLFAVPRIWEKFKAGVEAQVATYPRRRQVIFEKARQVGFAYQQALLEGRKPPVTLAAANALFDLLVFRRVRKALGLDQALLFGSAAAPIGRDVLDFWLSLGVVIREIYGQSEVTGPTTANRPGATRLGTVGKPLPGVEVRLADDGEIRVRGPNVFMGYYKDPAATAETLDAEGWLYSGDVGEFDADGYLRITDRKKDLIITSGGKKAAPQNLETQLKAIPPISQAMVVGERKNYLAALLTLDPATASPWAREHGFPEEPATLARDPRFRAYLQEQIDAMNRTLAKWETIKKFEVLDRDFTEESGELTPTLKLKRKVIAEHYRQLIESL